MYNQSIVINERIKGSVLAFYLRTFVLMTLGILAFLEAYTMPGKRLIYAFYLLIFSFFNTLVYYILYKKNIIRRPYDITTIFLDICVISSHIFIFAMLENKTAPMTSASLFLYPIFIIISAISTEKRNIVFATVFSCFAMAFNYFYFLRLHDFEFASGNVVGQFFRISYVMISGILLFFLLMRIERLMASKEKAFNENIINRERLDLEKKEKDRLNYKLNHIKSNIQKDYFFYSLTPDGNFIYLSPSIEKVLGYKVDEMGSDISEYLTDNPINNKGSDVKWNSIYEIEVYTKDKKRKYLQIVEIPIFSEDGKLISIDGIAHDIDADKKRNEELKRSERKLKFYSERITHIREEEKKRIATDLHDKLGVMAISIGSNLNIATEDIYEKDLKSAIKNLKNTSKILKDYIADLKNIAVELRPPNIDMIGLAAAMQLYFEKIEEKNNIRIHFDYSFDIRPSENISINLYRITQEALTNIIKYSKAKNVEVRLIKKDKSLRLNIKDDGKGFDISEIDATPVYNRIGIIGMKERALALGGEFDIFSQVERGTEIKVSIPLLGEL